MNHLSLGYLLGSALQKQQDYLLSALNGMDVSIREYGAMMILKNNQGLTQLETGNLLQMDRTSIGKLIDTLSDREWVERKQKPTDRRAYQLYLTEKGKAIIAQLEQLALSANDSYLSKLDNDERKQLLNILEKLIKENENE